MHRADLIAITPVRALSEEFRPFVEFKASLTKRELQPDQIIVLLLVESTSCYIPILIDEKTTLDTIAGELAAQDAELSFPSKEAIKKYLEEHSTVDNK